MYVLLIFQNSSLSCSPILLLYLHGTQVKLIYISTILVNLAYTSIKKLVPRSARRYKEQGLPIVELKSRENQRFK